MIKRLRLRRFKQFGDQTVELEPHGVTLIAGGNNAGKSSLLHGLAVWEFCRTAIQMERGPDAFLASSHLQGLGLGDDEFSPVALPSLKHLWTNLKTQKQKKDPDGYSLRIACDWQDHAGSSQTLEFGLALANDRLFVKVTTSTLSSADSIPRLAYLPPFAGITDREMKVSPAIRLRRTGEGLAGAVLRNLLLDMFEANQSERARLRGSGTKIKNSDLRRLRQENPWEVLQQTLRTRFGAELQVEPFRDEYHSYIRVEVVKGVLDQYKLRRYPGYNKRDLMVEGSGFLQWLSVYALATSPSVDVLLLDEPDAHLHPTLQAQLMESLEGLAAGPAKKQVLVATHSAELLRHWEASRILEVRSSGTRIRYLSEDHQKVGLLAGIGSDYAPRLDPIRKTRRVLFVEGTSDKAILGALAKTLGTAELDEWPCWVTSATHKERRQLVRALREEIPDLVAVSLRDRDDEPLNTSSATLADTYGDTRDPGFVALKWRRRHVENYLLVPAAISRATGVPLADVEKLLAENHAMAVPERFTDSDCPDAFMQANGKGILVTTEHALLRNTGVTPPDVAKAMRPDEIPVDIKTFLDSLAEARG